MVLCDIALAVRGEIALTGDMVPTAVLGLSVMVRLEGLSICTKADLVFLHIELLFSQRSVSDRFHPAE